ncbi:hypothetical protein FH972_020788 [Carpinus fangiana]|uniref:Uncharacterized protein n=1 Tax=Carpinus fangiana TaxID=176857 RepID=A0A5N6RXQ4_9ROSI|nr:hypothetical protein FH972_020788 [Carpinus fangiana]
MAHPSSSSSTNQPHSLVVPELVPGCAAEELAAALAASKGNHAQNDTDGAANQSSQTGYGTSAQGQYAPTFAGGQPRPIGMPPQPTPLGGFDMQGYPVDDEEMMKLRAERGARAGGWSAELGKKRALEEAFGSIWIC